MQWAYGGANRKVMGSILRCFVCLFVFNIRTNYATCLSNLVTTICTNLKSLLLQACFFLWHFVILMFNTPVSHHLSTTVQFDKRRIHTSVISIQCKVFTNSIFLHEKMLLFDYRKHIYLHSKSRLSLYKCVFCHNVQRCWSNMKLEHFVIPSTTPAIIVEVCFLLYMIVHCLQ